MLLFVKVIYHLSEEVEKYNQLDKLIYRKMMTQVCMVLF